MTLKITNRELDILKLICTGYDNPEIARKLFIAVATVEHHINSLYKKFETHSIRQMIYQAYKQGLVKSPNRHDKLYRLTENLKKLVCELEHQCQK